MVIRKIKITTVRRHHQMRCPPYMRHFLVVIFHLCKVSVFFKQISGLNKDVVLNKIF